MLNYVVYPAVQILNCSCPWLAKNKIFNHYEAIISTLLFVYVEWSWQVGMSACAHWWSSLPRVSSCCNLCSQYRSMFPSRPWSPRAARQSLIWESPSRSLSVRITSTTELRQRIHDQRHTIIKKTRFHLIIISFIN